MPDPQDRINVPIKGETVLRLSPFAQLQLRVQAMERTIQWCGPLAHIIYNQELQNVGLEKLNIKP